MSRLLCDIQDAVKDLSSLDCLPESRRHYFVTLHLLHSNTFLPALDIIDRKMIRCYGHGEVYFVSSTQGRALYEVRLGPWNCSCPAFALEAYGRGVCEDESSAYLPGQTGATLWGGRRKNTPICKHLLAAVLANMDGVFRVEKEDSLERLSEACAL